jgi:hypothetical protein
MPRASGLSGLANSGECCGRRKCLAIRVARKRNATGVIETLVVRLAGDPAQIRSDIGQGLVAVAPLQWMRPSEPTGYTEQSRCGCLWSFLRETIWSSCRMLGHLPTLAEAKAAFKADYPVREKLKGLRRQGILRS